MKNGKPFGARTVTGGMSIELKPSRRLHFLCTGLIETFYWPIAPLPVARPSSKVFAQTSRTLPEFAQVHWKLVGAFDCPELITILNN